MYVCISGEKLERYVLSQFTELPKLEKQVFIKSVPVMAFFGFLYLLYDFSKQPSLRRFAKLVFTQLTLWNTNFIAAFLSLSHFEQDITFMLGNIMHHTDISRYTANSNASFVDALPNGFLLNTFINLFWTLFILSLFTPFLKAHGQSEFSFKALMSQTLLGLMFCLWKIADQHPKFHQLANESFKDAWPYTFEYQAYKHVMVHHGDGDAFASNPILDPIFSAALYGYDILHNSMLGLKIGSPEETAVAIAYDWVLSLLVAFIMAFSICFVGSAFDFVWASPKPSVAEKKKVA
jgi:hypothetical protein